MQTFGYFFAIVSALTACLPQTARANLNPHVITMQTEATGSVCPVAGKIKHGQLTLVRLFKDAGKRRAECLCECGNTYVCLASNFYGGRTKSCGCTSIAKSQAAKIRHGKSKTPEHNIWCGIRTRCENPNVKAYPHYGGRGITLSDSWHVFENFLADMGPRPSPAHTVERRDVNVGYCKENCFWMLFELQGKNKRNNVTVIVDGKHMILADAAKLVGYSSGNALRRKALRLTYEPFKCNGSTIQFLPQ